MAPDNRRVEIQLTLKQVNLLIDNFQQQSFVSEAEGNEDLDEIYDILISSRSRASSNRRWRK